MDPRIGLDDLIKIHNEVLLFLKVGHSIGRVKILPCQMTRIIFFYVIISNKKSQMVI